MTVTSTYVDLFIGGKCPGTERKTGYEWGCLTRLEVPHPYN